MKKVIVRNLPIRKYRIIECSYTSEVCYCDNCNKLIKNIATIEDENKNTHFVGLDCAETLSGIDEWDILYYKEKFNIGKKIRTKLLKYIKEYGNDWEAYIERPYIEYKNNRMYIRIIWQNAEGDWKGFFSLEEGTHFDVLDDIVRYAPYLAERCYYNEKDMNKDVWSSGYGEWRKNAKKLSEVIKL